MHLVQSSCDLPKKANDNEMTTKLCDVVVLCAGHIFVYCPGEDIQRWIRRLISGEASENEALAIFRSLIRTRGVIPMCRVYVITGLWGEERLFNILRERLEREEDSGDPHVQRVRDDARAIAGE